MTGNKLYGVIVAAGLSLAPVALGHGSKDEVAAEAVKAAITKFAAEEAAQRSAFAGVKSWPHGREFRVKIYLTGKPELLYSCTMQHGAGEEPVSCAKQAAPR